MSTRAIQPAMRQAHADRIGMLYRNLPLALLAVLFNSAVLAAVLWPVIDSRVIAAWLAATWVASAVRFELVRRYRRARPALDAPDFWGRAARAGAWTSGALWGVAGCFLFAPDSVAHQALLAFVIAGMCAGAVATLSADRAAITGFVLLATLPLLYRFVHTPPPFGPAFSAMTGLFIASVLALARRFNHYLTELLVERHERRLAEQRERRRSAVLERLARGAPLREVLTDIAADVEAHNPGMLCSILLLDATGRRLVTGAAPRLPAFYNEAIDGLPIGLARGSCGTAAFTRLRVIVEDIREHPYWREYRDLAERAGLRACWSEPILGSDGRVLGTFAIYYREPRRPDETELLVAARAAHLAGIAIERSKNDEELRVAALVYQNSSEAMMITDVDDRVLAVNPAFTAVTGYRLADLAGTKPRLLTAPRADTPFDAGASDSGARKERWQGELWSRRKDGAKFAAWMTLDTVRDEAGGVYRRVALFSDVTEKKKTDALIWKQANYDALTQLPNRRLFLDRLREKLKLTDRAGTRLALLFIDLDRFKEVNDTLGHHLGDELLVEGARRIRACVREADTVARLGGDEFTVMLTDVENLTLVADVAQKIIDTLARPCRLGGEEVYISASIGITVYPDDATECEDLLKNADQALYDAKTSGRNRFSYFTRSMQELTQRRVRLIRNIREALAADQITVHFQPIVELDTGRIRKAEALVRWKHPEQGWISPSEFIPVAEDTGAIHEIGNRVFREAVRRAESWRARHDPGFQVSVNKSPVQFMAADGAELDWIAHLRERGLAGDAIAVEITEGLLLRATDGVRDKLRQFREAGIRVVIDDFGTGYSALAYLKRFEIDFLKIDRSFVNHLESDASDLALSEAIVAVAHKLGIKVIAEGVETPAQRDILLRIGCDYAQGYLFSPPLPAEAFEGLLAREPARTEPGARIVRIAP